MLLKQFQLEFGHVRAREQSRSLLEGLEGLVLAWFLSGREGKRVLHGSPTLGNHIRRRCQFKRQRSVVVQDGGCLVWHLMSLGLRGSLVNNVHRDDLVTDLRQLLGFGRTALLDAHLRLSYSIAHFMHVSRLVWRARVDRIVE